MPSTAPSAQRGPRTPTPRRDPPPGTSTAPVARPLRDAHRARERRDEQVALVLDLPPPQHGVGELARRAPPAATRHGRARWSAERRRRTTAYGPGRRSCRRRASSTAPRPAPAGRPAALPHPRGQSGLGVGQRPEDVPGQDAVDAAGLQRGRADIGLAGPRPQRRSAPSSPGARRTISPERSKALHPVPDLGGQRAERARAARQVERHRSAAAAATCAAGPSTPCGCPSPAARDPAPGHTRRRTRPSTGRSGRAS